jgi:hypothetical protein
MRTKYFLLHDNQCVWRWKNAYMTFVDLRSFGSVRRDSMDDVESLKKTFKVKQISYKAARKINKLFVN